MFDIAFYESRVSSERNLKTRRKVYGFGINDAPFPTQFHIKEKLYAHPAYLAWKSIICRCYNPKYIDRFPTYSGASVCEEWRSFMSFRSWWVEHHIDGLVIDKDIIGNGKVYSPSTCIFIPNDMNIFLTDSAAARGAYPIGCSRTKYGSFVATCSNPFTKKKEFIGCHKEPESAHKAWMARKIELAGMMKDQMDSIDSRIYGRVIEIIKSKR